MAYIEIRVRFVYYRREYTIWSWRLKLIDVLFIGFNLVFTANSTVMPSTLNNIIFFSVVVDRQILSQTIWLEVHNFSRQNGIRIH